MYASLSLDLPLLHRMGDYLSPGRTLTRHPLIILFYLAPSVPLRLNAYLTSMRTLTRYPSFQRSCHRFQTSLAVITRGAWPLTRILPSFMFPLLFLISLSSLLVLVD